MSKSVPILSLTLFCINIWLITRQKQSHSPFPNGSFQTVSNSSSSQPSLLRILDDYYKLIGINLPFPNLNKIKMSMFLLTYLFMSFIEMFIGSFRLFFFIILMLTFNNYIPYLRERVINNSYNCDNRIYCCGSFLFCATFGFLLIVLLRQSNSIVIKKILLILILIVYISIIKYDRTIMFKKSNELQQRYLSFMWHSLSYLIGILSALFMAH
jgi:hypothetical protein